MIRRALFTLCLMAMLAYGAGPVLDHCFPERDPFHAHLAAGPVAPHVEHYLLPVHQHGDGVDNVASDQSAPVAVRSFDAADGVALSGILALTGNTIAGLFQPELTSLRRSSAFQIPPSAVLSPPDKPPLV
ncbi:MAG: hypothetical protein Q7O66_18905 [Dehalococcoidia bacterium]|nr:hypothetical protein [Dehalococcoidia bacterium]